MPERQAPDEKKWPANVLAVNAPSNSLRNCNNKCKDSQTRQEVYVTAIVITPHGGSDAHAFVEAGLIRDAHCVDVFGHVWEVAGGAERMGVVGLHGGTASTHMYADVVFVDVEQLRIEPGIEFDGERVMQSTVAERHAPGAQRELLLDVVLHHKGKSIAAS
ncbi:hypothetical protein BBJ28_00016696 [Nothophytophthora sp. Chile5]|nr:hypothetical protein BBJ28_00016696 [Nothophytophthora sp. Chile5]